MGEESEEETREDTVGYTEGPSLVGTPDRDPSRGSVRNIQCLFIPITRSVRKSESVPHPDSAPFLHIRAISLGKLTVSDCFRKCLSKLTPLVGTL